MTGSCLCGAVAFESSGEPTAIELCHCPRCRKAYGTAFAATLYVTADSFSWTCGEAALKTYAAPIREQPPAYRHTFCAQCGSPLPIVDRKRGFAEIPAGSLDGDPGVRPLRHIFAGRKAAWFEITGDLPRHDAHVAREEHLLNQLRPPRGS